MYEEDTFVSCVCVCICVDGLLRKTNLSETTEKELSRATKGSDTGK